MTDEMVLKAQKWVNSTYGSVPGYVRCPEDGKTGWPVMYSLTRALQHELGITTLADGFGPLTTARLDAHGPIGAGEPNTNFIKIIQSACYCKGYYAGDIDGDWSDADDGVSDMMDDLGLGDAYPGHVTTKIFRALLTMDAYVLLSGGSEDVRGIQRWLNKRYWTRSWFNLIPTEGHYSRDVQKALMMALQSEFGIADEDVTGNFGPLTQAGLRAHELEQGATGIFVQLLSAACVFNGPITKLNENTPTHTVFKESFDAPLAAYLSAFQAFSLLAVNGRADYPTWCQLLVSSGDPDRPVGACDTRFTITLDLAQALKASGYAVVGRYLDEPAGGTLNKAIQPGELGAIFDGGLRVFPIWQYNAREVGDFSYAAGVADGALAHDRMVFYQFKPGAIVYFAVDYDAIDDEITSNILPYFRGVQSALVARGRRYLAGVYGSRNVCIRASNETRVAASFVSGMSWGFSGNLGFPLPYNWAFNQIKEFSYTGGGRTIDLDRDAHQPKVDDGIGREGVGGGGGPVGPAEIMAFVDEVWALAVAYGGDPNQRVMEYLRAPWYTTLYRGWELLLGMWDQEWIDYAKDKMKGDAKVDFNDPSTGAMLHLNHLAATANAVYLKGSGTGTAVTRGDFGGWGGDLISFYGEWRNNVDTWESGYAFCRDNLAQRGNPYTYDYADMAEDADGYLIGTACRAGARFHEEFRRHLGGSGHATRFQKLWTERFGGTKAGATAIARTMLAGPGDDATLDLLRTLAILKQSGPLVVHPDGLDAAKLQLFLDGFADTLADLGTTGLRGSR